MQNCKLHIISQTSNGKIFRCTTCNKLHIEYKNLNFNFAPEEFEFFKNYFLKLNAEHWENVNKNTFYKRKIMVPIGHRNFTAMFNSEEIHELKFMFRNANRNNKDSEFIGLNQMDSKLSLN